MAICSHKLFGYNLEFTRRVGYGGLYAEMIHNSKLLNDSAGFYPVEFDGLQGLGQCTERIHILSNTEYEWKVVAGENTKVRVLTEFKKVICSADGLTGKFSTKYNCPHACFEVVSDAPIRYISLRPADAFHGCRRDVLDLIKELRPATIRVPGGCYAERYSWKDGLLPIEDREPIYDNGHYIVFSAHERYDGHEINIDDYAAICRYLDAEMEYTVRLRNNDPKDAADIVEYCNGSTETEYGALRASRGYKEPYNVRTWYVGNELGFGVPYETAAEKNDIYTEAMLRVDPTIRTVVGTGVVEKWDDNFVKAAKNIDLCAVHVYLMDRLPDWNESSILTAADTVLFEHLQRAAKRYNGRKMLFDEWNLRWGCSGDSASAVYVASVMTMLIRNAENLNIDGASYFALVNEGAIRVYPDHACFAPDGEVLKRMVNHAGGVIELHEDKTMVKTLHEKYDYISVYNNSASDEKVLSGIEGAYEVLIPNGVWMKIIAGEGELKSLPPASIAFIRKDK